MRDFPPRGPDGPCWTQAALEAGSCAQVLRDQSSLALAFTNCHLAQSGRPEAPAPPAMSDATFAIYTEFFTHTADLCFHLQAEHYHERANDAIGTLTERANDYATLLRYAQALAGVVVVLGLCRAARALGVPTPRDLPIVLVAAHLTVCALGTSWAMLIAAAAGLARGVW